MLLLGSAMETRRALKARAECVRASGLRLRAERVRLGYDVAIERSRFGAELFEEGPCLVLSAGDHDSFRTEAGEAVPIRAILYAGLRRADVDGFAPVAALLRALLSAWGAAATDDREAPAPIRLGWAEPLRQRRARGVVLVPLRIECLEPAAESPAEEATGSFDLSRMRVRAGLAYVLPPSNWPRAAAFSKRWLHGEFEPTRAMHARVPRPRGIATA